MQALSLRFPMYLLLVLSSISAYSQIPERPNAYDRDSLKTGKWVICYDANWHPIQNCDSASFYRLLTYKAGKPVGPGGDYYADGSPQMLFDSLVSESPARFHGQVVYYGKSGAPTTCEVYSSGRLDPAASIDCLRASLPRAEEQVGERHPDYARLLNALALLLYRQGDYVGAEPLFRKALAITKSALGEGHPRYAESLNNLALLLYRQGDYAAAEPLFRKALAIYKSALGEENPRYATSLNNLAALLVSRGDYAGAEPLYREALAIQKSAWGEEHPRYAGSLHNLAYLLYRQGDYAGAEPLYRKALAIKKAALGEGHPDYALSLNALAYLLRSRGDYAAAEPLLRKALAIYKSALGEGHPDYALSLNALAYLLRSRGDYAAAEPLLRKALAIYKSALGEGHPDYANSLNNLAYLLKSRGDYAAAEPLFRQVCAVTLDHLEANFASLSEAGRSRFLQDNSFYFSNYAELLAARPDSLPASGLYDLQLRLKGLLLRSNQKVRRRIEASDDSVLIADYQAWNRLKGWLSNLYNMPVQQREGMGYSIDSLQHRADSLERTLSRRSEQFASTYSTDRYTWQDVRASLDKGEAAVEMRRIELEGDSVAYLALVVSQKLEDGLQAIVLKGPRRELDERGINQYRNRIAFDVPDQQSYDLYWRPFEAALAPYKTVYFAPAGTYYKLNLTTLYDAEKDQYLADRKRIRYVTSTQDLVKAKQRQQRQFGKSPNALLFGRPDYGEATDTGDDKRTFNIRGRTFIDLPGTEKEVNDIAPMLQAKAWKVRQYIGEEASEARVSKVENPNVLHIATHGYFVEDSTKGPMFTSGLILSEVGQEQPEGVAGKDGFLTATEAAALDLDETQLVILSACNTGSGKVSTTQGVYGLQRAFLEAGAEALIISLWPVSDAATSEFMPLFYEYWLESGDKRAAFQKAQSDIRQRYPSPQDWGAFVLVGE